MPQKFTTEIAIIGINPFVFVPENILNTLFRLAKRDKDPIPIKGKINTIPYKQTLVKYQGAWRLYINTSMLKDSPKRIGEMVTLTVTVDPSDRSIAPHTKLVDALTKNKKAKVIFDSLRPSLQNEIVRYISHLKTEQSVDKNVLKAIDFLLGKGSFVGRSGI